MSYKTRGPLVCMRRVNMLWLCLLVLCASVTLHAHAADAYPAKPIRWIVPFPPGGPTDGFSRIAASALGRELNTTVVIENIGGMGAGIGMQALARAAADGYSIGLNTTGSHTINPHLYGAKLGYDPITDFTPITLAADYVNVLVVNPKLGINNVAELIAWAKANPGKATFGSAGNGASNNLHGELLKQLTGAPMQHVPYRGSAPAMRDVIGGQLAFMFDIPITAMPQARAGLVKAIGVTADKRSPFALEVPTMAEAGIKGFAEAGGSLWFGVVGPAGMPRPIVNTLNAALVRALRSPEVRERTTAQGFTIVASPPEELTRVMKADLQAWGRIVRASGAIVD